MHVGIPTERIPTPKLLLNYKSIQDCNLPRAQDESLRILSALYLSLRALPARWKRPAFKCIIVLEVHPDSLMQSGIYIPIFLGTEFISCVLQCHGWVIDENCLKRIE